MDYNTWTLNSKDKPWHFTRKMITTPVYFWPDANKFFKFSTYFDTITHENERVVLHEMALWLQICFRARRPLPIFSGPPQHDYVFFSEYIVFLFRGPGAKSLPSNWIEISAFSYLQESGIQPTLDLDWHRLKHDRGRGHISAFHSVHLWNMRMWYIHTKIIINLLNSQ